MESPIICSLHAYIHVGITGEQLHLWVPAASSCLPLSAFRVGKLPMLLQAGNALLDLAAKCNLRRREDGDRTREPEPEAEPGPGFSTPRRMLPGSGNNLQRPCGLMRGFFGKSAAINPLGACKNNYARYLRRKKAKQQRRRQQKHSQAAGENVLLTFLAFNCSVMARFSASLHFCASTSTSPQPFAICGVYVMYRMCNKCARYKAIHTRIAQRTR